MDAHESVTETTPEEDAGRLAAIEEEVPETASEDIAVVAPDLAESLGDYVRAWAKRVRGGESGALPIIAGLVIIVIFFQAERSEFLSALNIVNLLTQATVFILFAAVEIFALVLSEVDLSAGYVAAVGGFIIAELSASPVNLPWWVAVLAALAATGVIGAFQGTLIARLHLPSFVVTLGGLLGFQGVMLILAEADPAAVGGVISISPSSPVYKLVNSNMSPALGWIVLVVVLAVYAALSLTRDRRRRAQGLTVPPISITILRIAVAAAGGIALVVVCNLNRGLLIPLKGVPWVVPFVGAVLFAWSVLLARTRPGRYIYAIGANPEAARRAGINVALIRTLGFTLCGVTACLAGLVYESRLGSMATNIDGGTLVLFGVAAAVIGGASLFGGRGKPLHALLGGIVVATVYNGLGLMGISAAGQDIATAIVLIAAVSVDALVRRRGATAV